MSATLSKGQKVKVRYTDAGGKCVVWDGVLKEQLPEGWRVDVGGVAIAFSKSDIMELSNEQGR